VVINMMEVNFRGSANILQFEDGVVSVNAFGNYPSGGFWGCSYNVGYNKTFIKSLGSRVVTNFDTLQQLVPTQPCFDISYGEAPACKVNTMILAPGSAACLGGNNQPTETCRVRNSGPGLDSTVVRESCLVDPASATLRLTTNCGTDFVYTPTSISSVAVKQPPANSG